MNKFDKIFCETHQCSITVSGCLLRQERNSEKPPAWMLNKIPGDPRCANCEQGKQVKKGNYKKEDNMNVNSMMDKSIEEFQKKKGPGRPPKKESAKPAAKETKTPEKTCPACGKTYPATREHFRGHNSTPDGLENRCKSCIGKTNILELDFSGRTNLLDKLTEMAAAEYRTPELQIMAMIAKEV
jgi:hypothetical protein